MPYPIVVAPTTVIGLIGGGEARFESIEGNQSFSATRWLVRNVKPVKSYADNQTWFLSNLQKKSRFGFLIQKPFCFHFWIMLRPQQQDENGGWISESEFGLYWRVGKWRFDVPGTMRGGQLRHWMGPDTWHLGTHWD